MYNCGHAFERRWRARVGAGDVVFTISEQILALHTIPWVADRIAMVGIRGCSMRWSLGVDGVFVCAVSVSSRNFTSHNQCLSPTVGWRVSNQPLTSLRHLHQCTTFDDSERGGMASAAGVHGVRFNRRTEGPTIGRERALEPVVTLKKNSPTNTCSTPKNRWW